jgi:hypothetical protein
MTTIRYHAKAAPVAPRVRARQRATYAAAAKVEKDLARYLRASLASMQGKVQIDKVARLIGEGLGPSEIFSIIERTGGESIEAIASTLADGVAEAVEAGAAVASAEAGGIAVATAEGAAIIDMGRPLIADYLRTSSLAAVEDLSTQGFKTVKAVIDEGVLRGRHPRAMARDIKSSISMTERDTKAWQKFRATRLAEAGSDPAMKARALAASDKYAEAKIAARAKTIAHTESMTAINKGREQLWDQLKEDGALPDDQRKEWITGLDELVCIVCGPLHGEKINVGESWAQAGGPDVETPPAHPNCVPAGQVVYGPEIEAVTRREYAGPLVEIKTAMAASCSVTPNHPVLTPRGWVAAGALREGDEVFLGGAGERVLSFVNPYGQDVPSKIEEVGDLLRISRPVASIRMPSAAVDFHGDGVPGGHVDAVATYRALDRDTIARRPQPLGDEQLCRARKSTVPLACLGYLAAMLLRVSRSAHRLVCRLGKGLSLLFAGKGLSNEHTLASISGDNSASEEPGPYGRSGDSISLREGQLGGPFDVKSLEFTKGHIDAGEFHRDRVASTREFRYVGHVYNLQTAEGWFSCNDIITSNCRCTEALVIKRKK